MSISRVAGDAADLLGAIVYNPRDTGKEDLLREAGPVRRFDGLRLPNENKILHFRHILRKHRLGQSPFEETDRSLASQGLGLRERTIVGASGNEALSSTENWIGPRDPEPVSEVSSHDFGRTQADRLLFLTA